MERATLPDVLTLEEASAYLRLPAEAVLLQALQGSLPGRHIEDHWRFLKTAIDEWLSFQSSRTILLQQAGALADDNSLAQLRATIYQARERSSLTAKTQTKATRETTTD